MNQQAYKILLIFFILPVLLLVSNHKADSQSLDLSSFTVETGDNHLMARFSVDVDEFEKIKETLDNGGKMIMICAADLFRKRSVFWNKRLKSQKVEIALEKDLLKGKYVVSLPEGEIKLKELPEEDFTSLFQDIKVELFPWKELETGRNYKLSMHIRLVSRDVPKWIKRTLFFWSWDVARDIRYETEFSL